MSWQSVQDDALLSTLWSWHLFVTCVGSAAACEVLDSMDKE